MKKVSILVAIEDGISPIHGVVSHFDTRYHNDETGAPAYPPAMLLKVVLFGYSQGLLSSRRIARACARDATFMALGGDSQPHFTTIAHFVSTLDDDIATVFGAVLAICQRQGLIGGELFAIDGVKLPSNASKHKSGTRADFERPADKLEATAKALLARHQTADDESVENDDAQRTTQKIEQLQRHAGELREWLATNPEDRRGASGKVVKSNRTDNESAKMATDKGVIQSYTGVAAVDDKHQIIVAAEAHGTGSEQLLLLPIVQATALYRNDQTLLFADTAKTPWASTFDWDKWHATGQRPIRRQTTTNRGSAVNGLPRRQQARNRQEPATKIEPDPEIIRKLIAEIRRRAYSIRTEQAYVQWINRFLRFNNTRDPARLDAAEVIGFLACILHEWTWVGRIVGSCRQNTIEAVRRTRFQVLGCVFAVFQAPTKAAQALGLARGNS